MVWIVGEFIGDVWVVVEVVVGIEKMWFGVMSRGVVFVVDGWIGVEFVFCLYIG